MLSCPSISCTAQVSRPLLLYQERCGERMAKKVCGEMFLVIPANRTRSFNNKKIITLLSRLPLRLRKRISSWPGGRYMHADLPLIELDIFNSRTADRHQPFFVPLTDDPDKTDIQVETGYFKIYHFTDPEPSYTWSRGWPYSALLRVYSGRSFR